MSRWLFLVCAVLVSCRASEGQAPDGDPTVTRPDDDFSRGLEALRAQYGFVSISAAVFEGGAVRVAAAVGQADRRTGAAATEDTIYQLASVSKPVVGLAIAKLVDLRGIDLDADINAWLGWSARNPDFPNVSVTLRQLATHRAGIASDGPDDYDTYPKPDPDVPLDQYLRGMLADPEYWLDTAPGAAESYSNLGAALAALVVERVDGRPFNRFCNEELFQPLGMTDTRWHFSELSAAQKARVARPHEDGQALEHYSYNDWPSGALRTTPRDLAKLWIMVTRGGRVGDVEFLSARALAALRDVPLFLEATSVGGVRAFEHSGGETGVTANLRFLDDGRGVIYVANSTVPEASEDQAHEAIEAFLEGQWTRR